LRKRVLFRGARKEEDLGFGGGAFFNGGTFEGASADQKKKTWGNNRGVGLCPKADSGEKGAKVAGGGGGRVGERRGENKKARDKRAKVFLAGGGGGGGKGKSPSGARESFWANNVFFFLFPTWN